MVQVNISTLKNELSAYLRKVRKGEEVLVMDRDRPVAKLIAFSQVDAPTDDEAHLAELERRGIITRAKGKLPSREWLEANLVELPPGVSLVAELLKEREEAPW